MRTHQTIIKQGGGPSAIGRIVGADPNTAKQWKRNDSIPAPYWAALAEAGVATLEELAHAAALKRSAA